MDLAVLMPGESLSLQILFPEPVGPLSRIGRELLAARFINGVIGLRAELSVMAVMAFPPGPLKAITVPRQI